MTIRRVLANGEMCPRGYGFAWTDRETGGGVVYPLPLNWILRFIRGTWVLLTRGPRWTHFTDKAYSRGYAVGFSHGRSTIKRSEGARMDSIRSAEFRSGWNACANQTQEDARKHKPRRKRRRA